MPSVCPHLTTVFLPYALEYVLTCLNGFRHFLRFSAVFWLATKKIVHTYFQYLGTIMIERFSYFFSNYLQMNIFRLIHCEKNRVHLFLRDAYIVNSLQGRWKVWKSGRPVQARLAFKTWCGHQNRVGIICPPGWDRVRVAAKTWCGYVPTSTCPQAAPLQ